MKFIVIVIILALTGFSVYTHFKPVKLTEDEKADFIRKNKHIKNVCKCWIAVFVALFVFLNSFVIIPTGYTGVRTTFKQISETTVTNGFNWKIPFVQDIEVVNNKKQDKKFAEGGDNAIWAESTDQIDVLVNGVIVTYQISQDKSAYIFTTVTDYKNNLISDEIVSSAVKITTKLLSSADATNRAIIEYRVKENLQLALDEKYGENVIIVHKIVVTQVDFTDEYNTALKAKAEALVKQEQQAIDNETELAKKRTENTIAKEAAEAEADVKRTQAQGEADAITIKAKAEKEANEMLISTLSDNILAQQYIEKWDGKLPTYMLGNNDNNTPILFGLGLGK